MSHNLTSKSMSDISTASTEVNGVDARRMYHGAIADINFRPAEGNRAVTVKSNVPVFEMFVNGPVTVMGQSSPQTRWIHLPANNMSWVEDLMATLENERMNQNSVVDSDDPSVSPLGDVLRNEVWKHVFHGRRSTAVHSRFLVPMSARYCSTRTDDPGSDEVLSKWPDANVLALYMPYLHWETYNSWKHRQRHIKRIKDMKGSEKDCDCRFEAKFDDGDPEKSKEGALLHQSLLSPSPLHDRRSLDHSYFYNLRNAGHKDEDQVIGLHTWNRADSTMTARKMMMTDQLWLWVIDNRTLVTCFPDNESDANNKTATNLAGEMFGNLQDALQQGSVKSINGLISFIVDNCTGVFHRSDIHPDVSFFEFFADEIGQARAEVEEMMAFFHEVSRSIEGEWTNDKITRYQMSRKLDHLFSIKQEINLMARIEKIVSDLDKIDFICSQQENVLRDLLKCSKTNRNLSDLCETIVRRRSLWAGMSTTTKATRDALHSLLDLKQRQASVSEARTIRGQIELTAKQGRSIMLLTVFTILFLPISVMATIFGMNATEFVGADGGKVPFSTISAIAFPVTFTLVLLALGFAFMDEAKKKAASLLSVRRMSHCSEPS